jgi:hypothetical protein
MMSAIVMIELVKGKGMNNKDSHSPLHFRLLLRAMEYGDNHLISDKDLYWLHDEFERVIHVTALFPQYKVIRHDAILNLNKVQDIIHARALSSKT